MKMVLKFYLSVFCLTNKPNFVPKATIEERLVLNLVTTLYNWVYIHKTFSMTFFVFFLQDFVNVKVTTTCISQLLDSKFPKAAPSKYRLISVMLLKPTLMVMP